MKLLKQTIPDNYLYFYADDMYIKGFYKSGAETAYCTTQRSNTIGYKSWFGGHLFSI